MANNSVTLVCVNTNDQGVEYFGRMNYNNQVIPDQAVPGAISTLQGILIWKGFNSSLTNNTILSLSEGNVQANNLTLTGDTIGALKPSSSYLIWGNLDFTIASLLGISGTVTITASATNAKILANPSTPSTASVPTTNFSFIVNTSALTPAIVQFNITELAGLVSLNDTSQIICQEQ